MVDYLISQSMTIADSSGGEYAALSNTSLHIEPFTNVTIDSDCTFAVLVEILQNRYYLLWKAIHPEDFPPTSVARFMKLTKILLLTDING